jgi:hypothetical protein
MPLRRKVLGAVPALGLVVLLAGCGGQQNPWKVKTGISNWFVNGIWDGLLAVPIWFFLNVLGGHKHQLYTRDASIGYYIVYLIALAIVALAIIRFLVGLVPRGRGLYQV